MQDSNVGVTAAVGSVDDFDGDPNVVRLVACDVVLEMADVVVPGDGAG